MFKVFILNLLPLFLLFSCGCGRARPPVNKGINEEKPKEVKHQFPSDKMDYVKDLFDKVKQDYDLDTDLVIMESPGNPGVMLAISKDGSYVEMEMDDPAELKKALKRGFTDGKPDPKMMEAVGKVLYPASYVPKLSAILTDPRSVVHPSYGTYSASTHGGGRIEIAERTHKNLYTTNTQIKKIYGNQSGYTFKEGDSFYEYAHSDFRVLSASPVVDSELYIVRKQDGSKIAITGYLRIRIEKDESKGIEDIEFHFGKMETSTTKTDRKYSSGVVVNRDKSIEGPLVINFMKSQHEKKSKEYDLASLTDDDREVLKNIGFFEIIK